VCWLSRDLLPFETPKQPVVFPQAWRDREKREKERRVVRWRSREEGQASVWSPCQDKRGPRGDLRRTSANGPESQRKSHDARADDAATCTHQQQQEKGRKRRQCTTRRPLSATTATKQLCPSLAIPVPFVPSFAIFDFIFGIFVTAFRRPLQRFRLRAPLRLCPHLRRWCLIQPFVVGCAGIPPLLAHSPVADGHYFHFAAARR
jgi:hypothetical protein